MPSSNPEHRRWYGLGSWKRRQKQQMLAEPCCRHCAEIGIVRAATIADHINPNWHTWEEFLSFELQSLDAACHARKRKEQRLGYRTDIGEDGNPRDKRHPFWNGAK
jgi:5-methylcytosine-specific restriction protein A